MCIYIQIYIYIYVYTHAYMCTYIVLNYCRRAVVFRLTFYAQKPAVQYVGLALNVKDPGNWALICFFSEPYYKRVHLKILYSPKSSFFPVKKTAMLLGFLVVALWHCGASTTKVSTLQEHHHGLPAGDGDTRRRTRPKRGVKSHWNPRQT